MEFSRKYDLNLEPGIDFTIKENHSLPAKMGSEIVVIGRSMYCSGSLEQVPKHEYLHIAQFKKYGSLVVLLHYWFFITINLFRYRNFKRAFSNVPFEVEARKYAEMNQQL